MTYNLLDKAISYIAPEMALRRTIARKKEAILLAYEGARTPRRQGGWNTANNSGNFEIGLSASKLRANARDLCRNNPYARRAKSEWANRVVGTGIWPRPKTDSQDLNVMLTGMFEKWATECCSDRRINWAAFQHQLVSSSFESGDGLTRLWNRRIEDGLTVPFQIQLLESDFLDTDKTQPTTGGNYIIHGVEFDALGRVRGFWLYPQHPGEITQISLKGFNSRFIPADSILHHAELDRPGDVRAVSRLASVISTLRDLDEWEDAEIVRKKICACMTIVMTQTEGSNGPTIGKVETDEENRRVETLNPGTIVYGEPGFDAKSFTPADNSDYAAYKKAVLREIAAGFGIPYVILADDWEAVNYSSFRGGFKAYESLIENYRYNWLIPQVLDPIYRKFIETVNLVRNINAPADVEWAPPQMELLDRAAEADADEKELAIGKTTWPQLIARSGYDAEKQIEEIQKWKSRREQAGILQTQGVKDNAIK